MRLGRGGANSAQGFHDRNVTPLLQLSGQNFRLIEFPFPLPRGEKRHGNEAVKGTFPDAFIRQPFAQKLAQNRGQGQFPAVFQAMNHLPHDSAAFPTGHGIIKMKIAVAAVCTDKGPQSPPEGARTDRASRRSDRFQVSPALGAQVIPADRAQAPGAMRWKKEIPQGFKPDPACVEHRHGEDTTRQAPR